MQPKQTCHPECLLGLDILRNSLTTRNPTGDIIVSYDNPLQFNAVGAVITATIVR